MVTTLAKKKKYLHLECQFEVHLDLKSSVAISVTIIFQSHPTVFCTILFFVCAIDLVPNQAKIQNDKTYISVKKNIHKKEWSLLFILSSHPFLFSIYL